MVSRAALPLSASTSATSTVAWCAASSGARSLSQRGRVREIKPLGSTAYPEAKADGDNSTPLKREAPERVYGSRPTRPARHGKSHTARIPVASGGTVHPPRTRPILRGYRYMTRHRWSSEPPARWSGKKRSYSRRQTECLPHANNRLALRECGIAYRT